VLSKRDGLIKNAKISEKCWSKRSSTKTRVKNWTNQGQEQGDGQAGGVVTRSGATQCATIRWKFNLPDDLLWFKYGQKATAHIKLIAAVVAKRIKGETDRRRAPWLQDLQDLQGQDSPAHVQPAAHYILMHTMQQKTTRRSHKKNTNLYIYLYIYTYVYNSSRTKNLSKLL